MVYANEGDALTWFRDKRYMYVSIVEHCMSARKRLSFLHSDSRLYHCIELHVTCVAKGTSMSQGFKSVSMMMSYLSKEINVICRDTLGKSPDSHSAGSLGRPMNKEYNVSLWW